MTGFWRSWTTAWCWAVTLFGVVLAGAAGEATEAPARAFFDLVDGARTTEFDPAMRFTVVVLGAVMVGWGLTLLAATRAAEGERGRPVWAALTGAVSLWYLIDSALSVATGYPLNALTNTAFFAAFLAPVLGGGVLVRGARAPARA